MACVLLVASERAVTRLRESRRDVEGKESDVKLGIGRWEDQRVATRVLSMIVVSWAVIVYARAYANSR